MWGYNDKVWMHYKGILTSEEYTAIFLEQYLRFMVMNRSYMEVAEVIDLQRYKIIKPSSRKLQQYIREKLDAPFIFLHFNN